MTNAADPHASAASSLDTGSPPARDQARRLYENGLSARAAAERCGLNERTVRRRAAMEGWVHRLSIDSQVREHDMRDDPIFSAMRAEREAQITKLLFRPSRFELTRYAVLRASEAAAKGSPTETSAWLRVLDQLRRNHEALAMIDPTLDFGDLLFGRLAHSYEANADGSTEEADDPNGAADLGPEAHEPPCRPGPFSL